MRLSDTVLVGFERGPEPVDGQADVFTAALQRIRAMPGVAAATQIRAVPFSGFHVPPIGVPGMADSPNVGGQLPHLIAATPEFLDILGIEVVQGRSFTAADEDERRRSRGHRQRDHGSRRVARSNRNRQMHPAGIRSFFQSDDRRRPARAADHGAMPRGRRHRARRASAVGRARRARRSAHAVLRALLTGPGPSGGHPCRPRHSGPARPDGGAGGNSRRIDTPRCRRWPQPIFRLSKCGRTSISWRVRCGRGAWGRCCWRPLRHWQSSSPAWVCSPSSHMPYRSAGVRWRFVWPSGRGRED